MLSKYEKQNRDRSQTWPVQPVPDERNAIPHMDHSDREREILLDARRQMKEFTSTVLEFTWFRGKRVMHTSIPPELRKKFNCTNLRTMGTWKQLGDYGIDLNHFRPGQQVKMLVQSVFIHDRKPEPELRGIPDPNFIHIIKEEKEERTKVHRLRGQIFDEAQVAYESYVSTVVDVMKYRGHTVMWSDVPQEFKSKYNTTDVKTVNAWPELQSAGIDLLQMFKKGDKVKMMVSDVALKGKYANGPLLYGLPDWNAPENKKYLISIKPQPSVNRDSLEDFMSKVFNHQNFDLPTHNSIPVECHLPTALSSPTASIFSRSTDSS